MGPSGWREQRQGFYALLNARVCMPPFAAQMCPKASLSFRVLCADYVLRYLRHRRIVTVHIQLPGRALMHGAVSGRHGAFLSTQTESIPFHILLFVVLLAARRRLG